MSDDLRSWLEARKRAAEVPHRHGLTLAEAEAVRRREREYIGVIESLAGELRHAVARNVIPSEALCACRYHRDWTDDDRCVDCGRPIGDTVRLASEDIERASKRGRGLDDDRAIWG